MKAKPKPADLMQRIAGINEMERGTLCRMPGRPYYNHQTWKKGRNVVRYVPRDQVAALRRAIAGHQRYLKLTQAYADEVIHRTRLQRLAEPLRRAPLKAGKPRKSKN